MKQIRIIPARRTFQMGSGKVAQKVVEHLLALYPTHKATLHLEQRMYDYVFGCITEQHFVSSVIKHALTIDKDNIKLIPISRRPLKSEMADMPTAPAF